MIPQRKLTRSGSGNGVSCRIEACRRRLRTVRANEAPGRLEERSLKSGFKAAGLNVAADNATFDELRTAGQDEVEIT
jgi:hypothetical protein